eukprot:g833.t1
MSEMRVAPVLLLILVHLAASLDIGKAVSWANGCCQEGGCSSCPCTGTCTNAPGCACAEFVSRSLKAGGLDDGLIKYVPYLWDYLSKSSDWENVGTDANSVRAGDVIIFNYGSDYDHTCLGVGNGIVDCHNNNRCSVSAAAEAGPGFVNGIFRFKGSGPSPTPGPGPGPAPKIQIWDCNNRKNQQWYFDGMYIRSGTNNELCIDVPNGDYSNGNKLDIWQCNGHTNQRWKGWGTYQWESLGQPGKCIDLYGGDASNGKLLEIWDCAHYADGGQHGHPMMVMPMANATSTKRSGKRARLGSVSVLHNDWRNNVLVQLVGSKRIKLVDPFRSHAVYLAKMEVAELQRVKKRGGGFTRNRQQAEKKNIVDNFPLVNASMPDPTRHPLWKEAMPLDIELRPGDVLLLPAYWFHEVESHASAADGMEKSWCIAINYWFRCNAFISRFWKSLVNNLVLDCVANRSALCH